jgi:hypothetical protein
MTETINQELEEITPDETVLAARNERRQQFLGVILRHELTEDLSPEDAAILQEGDAFYYQVQEHPAPKVAFAILGKLGTGVGARTRYEAAIESGIIDAGKSQDEVAEHPIVAIYDGSKGTEQYEYDAHTGKRYWPRYLNAAKKDDEA